MPASTRLLLAAEPVLPARLPEDRAAASRAAFHRILEREALRLSGWSLRAPRPLTTRAADGLSLLLGPEPRFALRAGLYLRAALWVWDRDWDMRVAAVVGRAEIRGDLDLADSEGEVFTLARAALAGLGRNARLAPGWARPPSSAARDRALFALADAVCRRWTWSQAAVLRDLLHPAPDAFERVSEETGLGRPALRKTWRNAGGWALEEAFAALERGRP